jgi:uncharacterized DUF497 family protein
LKTREIQTETLPKKDASNLVKHGIRLARASEFKPTKVLEDTRNEYGETRYRGFGHIGAKAYLLAFTVRESSQGNRVRAISLRPATQMEIKQYGLSKK